MININGLNLPTQMETSYTKLKLKSYDLVVLKRVILKEKNALKYFLKWQRLSSLTCSHLNQI